MDPEILLSLEKLHKALWEEMRAPCGQHFNKAKATRESAERILRQKLAKYNPRDIYKTEKLNGD